MGFAPIKWTCTAFFRPRQLTDRAILAMRQTQEKKKFTGEFYAHVFPFDPKFYRKAHPSGALLFSGVHSHLILLQHLLVQLPLARKPVRILAVLPKYWLEDDGTLCLFADRRWRSHTTISWLRTHGLHSVPVPLREEIGSLVYNSTRSRASDDPPPGL